MRTGRKPAQNKGFTMVEIAIVVAIISVMVAGALTLSAPIMKNAQDGATREKLERVAKAISLYAVMNNRIPCPAVPDRTPAAAPPFGYENGSGATGATVPDGCPLTGANRYRDGIIPFNTLGISEAMAKDAWGNFFTYGVSPAFTWNNKDVNHAMEVHPACRVREWLYDSFTQVTDIGPPIETTTTLGSRNPAKARFCCPADPDTGDANNGDLVILENSVPTGMSRVVGIAGYDAVDILAPVIDQNDTYANPGDDAIIDPDVNPAEYYATPPRPPEYMTVHVPAFVIVSHGANGIGAYLVDNGGAPIRDITAAGARETENANGDKTYQDFPTAYGGANPYDDLVLWRTQEQIMAEYGQSCNMP